MVKDQLGIIFEIKCYRQNGIDLFVIFVKIIDKNVIRNLVVF